jgi:hypothetical protein
MATFNAEGIIKTVEKRLDKLEASVSPLEKSVKTLIDTRGDTKEDAVKKLQLVVKDQADAMDKIPGEQVKALREAMKQNEEQFERLVGAQRARDAAEFKRVDEALHKETRRVMEGAEQARADLQDQIKRLEIQALTQTHKREEATMREMSQMDRKLEDAIKAQTDALKTSAILEARFIKLEAMLNALMAIAASRPK